jgi:predicted methyltransferase
MLTIVLPFGALAAFSSYAQDYSSLLAAPDRTDADRENDKKREAEKLLTFIGPKPGWRVISGRPATVDSCNGGGGARCLTRHEQGNRDRL